MDNDENECSVASRQNTIEKIDWFLDQKNYTYFEFVEIMAGLAGTKGRDPHGILVPLLNQDLNGVEEGLNRWWLSTSDPSK
jgi:hypothetical protein